MATADSTIPQKQCSKCKRLLPLSCFVKDNRKRDGLYSSCKECVSQRQKTERVERHEHVVAREKALRDAKKDEINAQRRERYAENPEPIRARNRNSYQLHIEKRLATNHDRHAKRREEASQNSKIYYRANKYRYHAASARRLARVKGLPAVFSSDDWLRAVSYFNGCCAVCGRPPGLWHRLAADHWIPVHNPQCPGTIPTNIVPLCHGVDGCNSSKRHTEAQIWLKRRFGEKKANQVMKCVMGFFEWVQTFQS